jgi:hypothetical protein
MTSLCEKGSQARSQVSDVVYLVAAIVGCSGRGECWHLLVGVCFAPLLEERRERVE